MKFIDTIILCILLYGCGNQNSNDHHSFYIELNRVFINYYEDDSLNRVRPYVIPKVYYDFNVVNPTADSIVLILNNHFDKDLNEPQYLYVNFEYNGINDTLLLTDYECVNPLVFTPNSEDRFLVGVPVSKYLEKNIYKSETASSFMKYVADYGLVFYNKPNQEENKKVLKSQNIKKSKNFEIAFTDKENTAVD